MTTVTTQVGVHNYHVAPPRLFPLIAYSRLTDVHFDEAAHAPSKPTPVLAPAHVLTGSLRRGWCLGCVALLVDEESELVKARTAVAKEVLAMRPASISYEEWSDRLAAELMANVSMDELRARAARWVEEAKAN